MEVAEQWQGGDGGELEGQEMGQGEVGKGGVTGELWGRCVGMGRGRGGNWDRVGGLWKVWGRCVGMEWEHWEL